MNRKLQKASLNADKYFITAFSYHALQISSKKCEVHKLLSSKYFVSFVCFSRTFNTSFSFSRDVPRWNVLSLFIKSAAKSLWICSIWQIYSSSGMNSFNFITRSFGTYKAVCKDESLNHFHQSSKHKFKFELIFAVHRLACWVNFFMTISLKQNSFPRIPFFRCKQTKHGSSRFFYGILSEKLLVVFSLLCFWFSHCFVRVVIRLSELFDSATRNDLIHGRF